MLVASALVLVPAPADADVPKLDILVFAGPSTTTYVDLLETGRVRDTFIGWQVGFGPRVRKGAWFGQVLLSFNRWAFRFTDTETGLKLKGRVNAFELPFTGGYIPYQNPYFKLFLYAGFVNHFNTRVIVTASLGDESVSFKERPKAIELVIYQALARFGIAFDLAMFNVDFNYSIGMNSATTAPERNSYHQLQLNVAYLF